MTTQKLIRAAAYCRTSTVLRQDPRLQLANIREYATQRKFQVVGEYLDQITGTTDKRPELNRMLADIKRRKIDCVIVTGLDRLGRNAAHLLKLAEDFREYDVGLISLREAIDLQSPSGKAFFTILAAISELDRNAIAERIRHSLAAKKLIAEQTGNGWRCGRPTKLNEDVEREILGLKNEGLSIRQIARRTGVSKTTVLRVVHNLGAKATGKTNNDEDQKP